MFGAGLSVVLGCLLLGYADSRPVETNTLFKSTSERSWLWGWAWGGAQSTVSVVDRSPIVSFASRPAAFGAEISEPILGYVIPLSSFTRPCYKNEDMTPSTYQGNNSGCPDLCLHGPHQPEPSETWIALVQRGDCEFAAKTREAQRLGAKAVVVGGSDPELTGNPDSLVNMFSPEDASDISIAATFIKYSDYISLMDMISSSNTTHAGLLTVSLLITAEYSAWEWYSPIITFFVILILPSILTLITLLIHRIRAARAAQRDRAPEDVVRSLPWCIWTGKQPLEKHWDQPPPVDTVTSAEEQDPESLNASTSQPPLEEHPWFEAQTECAICLSDFAIGDKIRVLPCHHVFHLEEVDEWLIQRKKLCPICKCDVTQPNRDPDEEEEGEGSTDERTPLLGSTGSPSEP